MHGFWSLVCLLGFAARGALSQKTFSFITLGDWGGADTKPAYAANVKKVAKQMAKTANAANAKFVVNTGDSFYWCGLKSLQDQQIQKDFTGPFGAMPKIPWYSVLGNHGYGYSADVQVQYSGVNPQWIMPSRYYTKRVLVDSATSTHISFIFLDTSPCIKMYRATNAANYDPCGTKMPTCSLSGGDDDFEGTCDFHQNIMSQSCDQQFSWFQTALSNVPSNDWLIVVGHHPADEINVKDFTTAMQKRGFSLYLNGHAHTLTQYTIDNAGAYITSGAGSLVNTPDQNGALMQRKLNGDREVFMNENEDGSYAPLTAYEYWSGRDYYGAYKSRYSSSASSSSSSSSRHTYQTVFNKKVAGFTLHTFSTDFKTLKTQFLSYDGAVQHTFSVNRRGKVSSAGGWWGYVSSLIDTARRLVGL